MEDSIKKIKLRMSEFSDRLEATSLFNRAKSGEMSAKQIGAYLANAHELVSATPRMLSLAICIANEQGRPDLAVWYETKLSEETGHDQWSTADLKLFTNTFTEQETPKPVRAILDLLDYLDTAIRKSPVSYLGYIILAEGITVMLGDKWSTALKTHCGLPDDGISVIDKHVIADSGHTEENYRDLPQLVKTANDADDILEVLKISMQYYLRQANELEKLELSVAE